MADETATTCAVCWNDWGTVYGCSVCSGVLCYVCLYHLCATYESGLFGCLQLLLRCPLCRSITSLPRVVTTGPCTRAQLIEQGKEATRDYPLTRAAAAAGPGGWGLVYTHGLDDARLGDLLTRICPRLSIQIDEGWTRVLRLEVPSLTGVIGPMDSLPAVMYAGPHLILSGRGDPAAYYSFLFAPEDPTTTQKAHYFWIELGS